MNNSLQRLREITEEVCARLDADASETGSTAPVHARSLVEVARILPDSELESTLTDAARGRAEFDRVIAVLAGEAARRSARALGHSGLAQRKGHRSAVQLVQSLTGESKGEASRQVKVGELLGEADAAERLARARRDFGDLGARSGDAENHAGPAGAGTLPWQHPITSAINAGTLSADSGHAILRILGSVSDSCTDETRHAGAAELARYATTAGHPLLREELVREARRVRDRIDTAGIEERFFQRYERRSLKTWHDSDGALNVHMVCDDESGVFVRQMIDVMLSPRRGGPRFTDPSDVDWANRMVDDPRTNEQLSFDTFLEVLRAGAACDESTVFRTDRPAVRVITVVDEGRDGQSGIDTPRAELEGSDFAVPAAFAAATECERGRAAITIDTSGCILNFGRSRRQFSSSQREVLRARDGGCLWPACERPPWQTEAHHIRPWSEGGGTDIADGVLLCRFHHLSLHAHHWRIVRNGSRYSLIPPAGTGRSRTSIPLPAKSVVLTSMTTRQEGTTMRPRPAEPVDKCVASA